ncbi:MAG: endo-1,4-beta-xylanase [Bacteroidales bacterium]|nr:endo-1,4-beta-xylanase [Bacteroidales bacterium]
MKNYRKLPFNFVFVLLAITLIGCAEQNDKSNVAELSLKQALDNKFLIGVAMNTPQIEGVDTTGIQLINEHFNSIVAENCMKSEVIQPEEGKFDFNLADKFVEFGKKNNMFIIGHTLIWHSQAPKWFFVDEKGATVSREVLIERMKTHITTLVSRYKGRVNGWDVVNEAIVEDGSFRKSKFYEIIGEDFVKLAFQFAHEADPDAELYYNDYSMAHEGRRNGVVNMIKNLQNQDVKVDGIGMQGHCNMEFPAIDEYEKSLMAFSNLGVKVMITELDITILPSPTNNEGADVALNKAYSDEMNPYSKGLPDSVALKLHDRYHALFKLFLKHSDKISRVTLWGLTDSQSWRNYWPIRGRTDYPLLFDREYKAKPIVQTIINEASLAK